jgi:hypothetical protein
LRFGGATTFRFAVGFIFRFRGTGRDLDFARTAFLRFGFTASVFAGRTFAFFFVAFLTAGFFGAGLCTRCLAGCDFADGFATGASSFFAAGFFGSALTSSFGGDGFASG